jgi:hypothetical protein
LAAAALVLGPAGAATAAARAHGLYTQAGVAAAKRFARGRAGLVSFVVLDERGRLSGLGRTVPHRSASVSKAMLMVAALRRASERHLTARERRLLRAMVTVSDNDAADEVYGELGGDRALVAVAALARMRHFRAAGHWSQAQLTAVDQARLFLRIDRLVPLAHRAYARALLSSIVSYERWGIAPVAARRGLRIYFKGGWRPGITHQVALLERGRRRIALAVLTTGEPSIPYGERTIEGIAARVLRGYSSNSSSSASP